MADETAVQAQRPAVPHNGYYQDEPAPIDDRLVEIEARHQAATPGPYRWRGNAGNYDVHLRTTWGGGYYVLGFRRWGWGDAEPVFLGRRVEKELDGEPPCRVETPFVWEPDAVDLDYDRRVRSWGEKNGKPGKLSHPYTPARPLNTKRLGEVGRPTITPAHHYLRYEVGYRHDIVGIAHPDAIAIERAWEDREWLIAEVKRLRAAAGELEA